MSTEELAPAVRDETGSVEQLAAAESAAAPAVLVIDELLVEEISIDGMCGVY